MTELSPMITLAIALLAGLVSGGVLVFFQSRARLQTLQTELTELRTQHQLLQQRLEAEQQEHQNLQSKHEQQSSEQQRLQQHLVRAQTSLDNQQARLGEKDTQIHELENQQAQLRRQLTEAQQEHSRLRELSKGFETTAEQRAQQLAEVKAQLQQLQQTQQDLQQRYTTLSNEYAELKTSLSEKQTHFDEQRQAFEKNREQLKTEFQNLANQIFEEKGKTFTQTSQASLDTLLKPFREQIDGFQKRVNEVHSDTVKGNTALEAEIKKVLDVGLKMSDEATNLTSALKGEKKTAGNWGEVQLEKALQLAGLLSGEHYAREENYKDLEGKNRRPDFIVKLPDGKHIILDSKVSLIDYDRAIAAETDIELHQALNAHSKAVRNHIDGLSQKDYSNLIGMRSPNFVLMFMPIEPAYIEAMKHDKELFNYGYEKNVVMVSHTTLMPILRTVANLWLMERSSRDAQEIANKAGDIYNQVCTVAEYLQNLGKSLNAVSNHYNKTVTALAGQRGLYGKVDRFTQLSAKISKKLPENLEPLHADFESERLNLIVETQTQATQDSLEYQENPKQDEATS